MCACDICLTPSERLSREIRALTNVVQRTRHCRGKHNKHDAALTECNSMKVHSSHWFLTQ